MRAGLVFVGWTLLLHSAAAAPAESDLAFVSSTYFAPPHSSGRRIGVPAEASLRLAIESAGPGDVIEFQTDPAALSVGALGTAWIRFHALSPLAALGRAPRAYTVVPPGPVGRSDVAQTALPRLDYALVPARYADGGVPWVRPLESPHRAPGSARHERGWPMRGHDRANSGHSAVAGPARQSQPHWTFRPDPPAFVGRPAVAADGTVYVTTAVFAAAGVDGRLYALWPDGSVKWQAPLTSSDGLGVWTSATPVVDRHGNIFVVWAHALDSAGLTAISFDTRGNVRWRFEPKVELESASHQQAVLAHGVLYAAADTSFFFEDATHRAFIFALDARTGAVHWHWSSPNLDTFFDGPAVGSDGHIYHASAANPLRGASGHLYRIRPNGELDWSIDIGAGVISAPPVIDARNDIYVADGVGVVSKYSAAGDRLWTYETLSGQIYMSPSLNGTRLMVGAAGGLHVLATRTGERRALFAPGEYPFSQASDRTGNVFFFSFNARGTVFAFGRGGRQRWAFDTGIGSSVNAVAIAGTGTLLVSNSETLRAYVAPVLGDLNCDGQIDTLDFVPFIIAISDAAKYERRHPQCDRALADIDGDGASNSSDIVPFLGLIG